MPFLVVYVRSNARKLLDEIWKVINRGGHMSAMSVFRFVFSDGTSLYVSMQLVEREQKLFTSNAH